MDYRTSSKKNLFKKFEKDINIQLNIVKKKREMYNRTEATKITDKPSRSKDKKSKQRGDRESSEKNKENNDSHSLKSSMSSSSSSSSSSSESSSNSSDSDESKTSEGREEDDEETSYVDLSDEDIKENKTSENANRKQPTMKKFSLNLMKFTVRLFDGSGSGSHATNNRRGLVDKRALSLDQSNCMWP